MLLGYKIHGADAMDKLLGDDLEFAPISVCSRYKCIYDINFLPDNFNIPKRKKDLFETIDGFMLVSEEFKNFCKKNKYRNLEFIKLSNTNYYWFKTKNIVEYDYKTRDVWFYNYIKKCKAYEGIYRSSPVCLLNKKPLGDNFYRSDISFGEQPKSPEVYIGNLTMEKIKNAGFKAIYFEKILDKYKKLPDMELLKKTTNDDFSFLNFVD